MAAARRTSTGLFRLLPQHIQDLRDVASGSEEGDAGICCSYLIDAASGEGADYDEHALAALERFADRALEVDIGDVGWVPVVRQWRARVLRARRALRLLRERGDHQHASVLYVAHGHPDPIVAQLPPLATLPSELRSLARYTATVEAWRGDMVRMRAREAAHEPPGAPSDLARHRALMSRFDHQLSSGDALRDALAPFHEPLVRDRAEDYTDFATQVDVRKARRAAYEERRECFLADVQREALRMLSHAEAAYYAAWLTVSR